MLTTNSSKKNLFLELQITKERQDVTGINCLRNEDGIVVARPELVKKKWKEYMDRLMNVKNTWDGRVEADVTEGPKKCITEMEVENALSAMKLGKALPTGELSRVIHGGP